MWELNNIDRLAADAREKTSQFAQRLLELNGPDIESIIVYGSAAGVNFRSGVSDINVVAIVRRLDFGFLRKNVPLVAWGRRLKIPAPLFLTREYINGSLDIFPIEYGEIKDHHVLIYGKDIFAALNIDGKYIRIFCEEQIKGKLLRLRQAYLETNGKPQLLRTVLIESLNALIPAFRQMVRLGGGEPKVQKEELFEQLKARFSINTSVFAAIHQDKRRVARLSDARLQEHFEDYLQQLEHLAGHIDHL